MEAACGRSPRIRKTGLVAAAGRNTRQAGGAARLAALGASLLLGAAAAEARLDEVVADASAMVWRANGADPGLGLAWTVAAFDDASWAPGAYGVGYETGTGADALLRTRVPPGTASVYTRLRVSVASAAAVRRVWVGGDHDDGFVVWLNGVEIHRSASMPAGPPAWNTAAASHESSNGTRPVYAPIADATAAALPALRDGTNTLAIGVWNDGPSSDLVLVPYVALEVDTGIARGPYLQSATPTSLVVRWRSTVAATGVVRFGLHPAALTGTATGAAGVTEHAVALTGLQPDTTYYYSVGSPAGPLAGGDLDHAFRTPPVAGTARPLRVWVLGDAGTGDANARAVRDAYLAHDLGAATDAVLLLGDNAYPDGTDADYQLGLFDMYPRVLRASPVWPTFGNHDARSAASATGTGVYYDAFTLPRAGEAGGVASGTEAYYSFDVGNVHFVCLDSQDSDRSPGGAMMTWLRQDLASTLQDWVIAFWHHPPYSKGSHDSDAEQALIDMRVVALPLLEAAGVDLVLSGHSHSYERSYLLDGHYGASGSLVPSMVRDAGDGDPEGNGAYAKPPGGPAPRAGAVYAVSGSAGKTTAAPLDHPAMRVSLLELGSLALDVSGNRLDATFLDDLGRVRDRFSLFKGSPVPPRRASRLSAWAAGIGRIDLAWTDASTDEDGFEIERSPDGVGFVPAGTAPANATGASDPGRPSGSTWTYRVRAFNAAGVSAWTNPATATVAACAPPGAMGNVLRLARAGAAARAAWQDVPGAASYHVRTGPAVAGPFPDLAASGPSGAGAGVALPPAPGALVPYRVAAVDACGEGPP